MKLKLNPALTKCRVEIASVDTQDSARKNYVILKTGTTKCSLEGEFHRLVTTTSSIYWLFIHLRRAECTQPQHRVYGRQLQKCRYNNESVQSDL